MEEPPFEVEASSDEMTDSDLEDDPEAQFHEALRFIERRHESLSDPETLYEFLFKYRDVLEYSSPVSGTLLHSIAKMMVKTDSGFDALAKRLIQEHPKLLCKADSEGLTPVSMAVVGKERQLLRTILRACSDDLACRQALEEALKIPDFKGKTVLHHASRSPSTFRVTLMKLMAFATDEALGIKDGSGYTPLHYVVSSDRWRHSLLETVELFLDRDTAAQNSSRNGVPSSEQAPTFLDVVENSGLSVYQCLISSIEKHEEAQVRKEQQQLEYKEPEIHVTPLMSKYKRPTSLQDARRSDRERITEGFESMSQVSERFSESGFNMKRKLPVKMIYAKPRVEAGPATTKPKNKDILGFVEISSKIAQRLKLHYVRTRDITRATRFLYGENIEDTQLYFNYTGGPAEVKRPQFEAAFESTKFCDVLKFVAFPSSVSVIQDTPFASNVSMTRAAGFGRRDMEFFSEWLQKKGVTHIISMQVYDFGPCHSDSSIAAVLQPFEIDDLDWRKIDLDPRTIQEACNEVRSLTLWWGGNNTTLRAWSEPTGLPALPHLERLSICLPREIQAADSMSCVENNISEFRKRLDCSLDTQTGETKSSDRGFIEDSVKGLHHAPSLTADTKRPSSPSEESKNAPVVEKGKDSLLAEEGEDLLPPGDIDVPIPDRTAKASTPDIMSTQRSIQVQFSASRALSDDLGESVSETEHITAPGQWLRSVDKLSQSLSDVWDEVQKLRRDLLGRSDEPHVIALIDDGVDMLDPSIPNKAVHGGTSFAMETGHRLEPWWVSKSGHGTMVASLISWVCPMAQVYSIRVGPTHSKEVYVRSLARALESASRKANIVVLSSDIYFPSHDSLELDRAIQEARRRGSILLRPMPDPGLSSSGGDAVGWQDFWNILSARDEKAASGLDRSTLVLPGTKAVVSHLGQNKNSDLTDLLAVLSRVEEDESSVATALAAGLISLLIYCYKLAASYKALVEGPSASNEAETSLRYVMQSAGMQTVLNNLGDLTEDRVVKVWQTLDPLSQSLGDESRSLGERVNQLATMTKHLALGLRD